MRYLMVDGTHVSAVGLGTWQFGSREWGYGESYATEIAPALLRRAVELGVTMIDTAEVYGFGRSERIVGGVLDRLDPADRTRLTVATKFMPVAPAEPIVAWQATGSRDRLGERELDLYYVHWPNPFVSARRTMQSLRPLVDDGIVRRVGVSNHSLERWRESERALGAPVVANQVRFNLLSPQPAVDLVPYAADAGRLVVAYSPLAQGLLAATDDVAMPSPSGIRRRDPRFRDGAARFGPLREVVREVGVAHGATPAQVALAWVLRHPNTVAIPGARTIEQLEENVAAAHLELSADEVARLTEAALQTSRR